MLACYNPTMKKFGLAVSLAGAVRPVLAPLNRELASRSERAVSREEWPELDELLHEDNSANIIPGMRCSSCAGYLTPAGDGEFTCLNCARSAYPRREVAELVERLARRLIENRNRRN